MPEWNRFALSNRGPWRGQLPDPFTNSCAAVQSIQAGCVGGIMRLPTQNGAAVSHGDWEWGGYRGSLGA
jgi:hypothetical protein